MKTALILTCASVACAPLQGAIRYVNVHSANPSPPYLDWSSAASGIQEAVDAAWPGDEIVVTNGVYQTGSRQIPGGSAANRIMVKEAVTVRSVNGPDATVIRGEPGDPTRKWSGMRCAYLAGGTVGGAVLVGFTLTNGESLEGGGVYGGTLSNCVLRANTAVYGGGAASCRLVDCLIEDNSAEDGGGAWSCELVRCAVVGNQASVGGGFWGPPCAGNDGHGPWGCPPPTTCIPWGCSLQPGVARGCTFVGNVAHLGAGAYGGWLDDCTLTHNRAEPGEGSAVGRGGGAASAWLRGCLIRNNRADTGGGAFGAILHGCVVTGNSAVGSFGGGAHRAWLFGCTLSGNAAAIGGGGACMSMLENCVLTSNAASEGGGAWGGRLSNCSIVANTASSEGGGVWSQSGTWGPSPPPVGCDDWCDDFSNAVIGVVRNCIVYNNTAPTDANHAGFTGFGSTGEGSEFYGGALNHSCTTPLPTNGVGNITNAPLFVDVGGGQPSNFRLQPDSPCINAGRNAYATGDVDRDSNPRIVGGTVDLGAYEYQMPQSTISYAWLQQYGLPTDGSADLADPDGDGHNNSQEWHAWTDPTDSTSVLRLLTPLVTTDGLLVRWQSLNGDNPALSVPGPAPTTAIGQWRPTPPNFAAAFGTQARYLTPWTMRSPAQFRPGPPPSLTSAIYTADYNEIRVLGSRGNANRRPEQAASAELQEKGEDWLADVYRQHPLPLLESARREALVWMAGMDAQIQIFDAKYAYNFWRPITAIRTGALDGNDDTPGDPAWTPFLDTHNHPDYPSALVLSTAAMLEILVLLHGDQFSFSATSTNPDRTRTFAKLSDYVEDAITARVVGGTHFRHTCNVSAETGRQIARYAFQRYLRPVPRLQTGPSQPGEFTLVLQADLPFRYSIERSSDLVQWLPWQTIVPGPIRLNDTNAASAEQRFYRAGVDW